MNAFSAFAQSDLALSLPKGQGWLQLSDLLIALALSAIIGLEREVRGKSAGVRTHAIIGFAAALFMLVSKYGFDDVLGDEVLLDPSRVAAQIVSGIGFIGGGIIFVRKDAVRGLTTAASVWLTTAVGMAAGAGLHVLAVATTIGSFVVLYGLRPLVARLPGSAHRTRDVHITYAPGKGSLRQILQTCTESGWSITRVTTHSDESTAENVVLSLHGGMRYDALFTNLANLRGVHEVGFDTPTDED